MPPKLKPESQKDQAARFKREAERLIAAGELDPITAEATVDALVRKSRRGQGP